tara:strand:- start:551 stop:763 length:213 start_codon:yes stop_codon:yes gene_type:complete
MHHRPARHANRSAVGAEAVVVAKAESLFDERIDVGSLNMRVSPGANRVRPLIISKKEQDVWFIRSLNRLG